MTEMKTLTAGGETYTVTDGNAVHFHEAQSLTEEQKAQARANIGAVADSTTYEKYFVIDDDGVIALKPEYRGASTSENYPLAISDNGVGVAGSKNAELPECIVIPEVVGETPVNALAQAMFRSNLAVKEITIPASVKEIPKYFAALATNLRKVHGTEHIESMGSSVFYTTGITKAIFPNLTTVVDTQQFARCPLLLVADIGHITSIPKNMFLDCAKLHTVRNGENVITVGDTAFYGTHRLKAPAFLPSLTSIGKQAFLVSRTDYDWDSLSECTFGTMATRKQLNPTDYWSACTYSECNTPLLSTFDQENPLWVNETVGNKTFTYDEGCVMVCAAEIYSAFMNQELSSPQEFEAIVRAIDTTLLDGELNTLPGIKLCLEAVGFTVTENLYYNTTNLQTMYDALANGSLVMSAIYHGMTNNHCVVFHGINANGEVLVCDSYTPNKHLGIYEADRYAMPIQNIAQLNTSWFIIVSKPEETT